MFTANRIETNVEPKVILLLGDGSYYYNYDIKAKIVTVSNSDLEEIEETRWDFILVHLYGAVSYSECVKAIIRAYVSLNEEFDLINSANRYILGLSTNSLDEDDYKEYLQLVTSIKDKVKNDLNG